MRHSRINLLILFYMVNICYFIKNELSTYNNFKNISYIKKYKRNIDFSNRIINFYSKNIIINKQSRKKRMIRNHPQAKWNFPIPYFVDRGVSKFLVDRALLLIEKDTCIKFENYRRIIPGMAGLHYFYGIGCNSHVGKLGRRTWQLISIGYGCDLIGRIQHETFHALGLYHTHSRHDRDQYLYFNLENVDINAHNNFEMVPQEDSLTFSVPFDFGSLMMYARKGFSSNGRDTILSHDYHYRNTYGSLQKPSFADLKMLNFLYCSKKCSIKLTCFNGGYQDPNNCSTCKCVDGFIGSFCSMYSRSTKECKTSKLFATNKIKEFGTTGKKNCIYHILASKNQKIAIKVIDTYFFPNGQHICYEKNSLEIKYWNDKVATGARFCLHKANFTIYSYNYHVIIYFKSEYERNFFHIAYRSFSSYDCKFRIESEFSKYNS